jgi:ribosomal protein S18 acetylase RimI-like enzyme
LASLKLGPAVVARFVRCDSHTEHLHKRDAPAQHWYLWLLGVEPPRQGQGIGSA